MVNQTTKVLYLQEVNGRVVPNFKPYYPGLSSLGLHFLVRCLTGTKPARHYTVCNVMRPNVYQALVQALKKDGAGAEHLLSMLTTQDENRIALTIKNYKQPTGLSEKFFERFTQQNFEVKGPMGKPLGIESTGTYVCFAGGTGLLPFMDLVGQLAFANLGLNPAGTNEQTQLGSSHSQNDRINPVSFKLRMYVSFQSRQESLGMELLLALEAFCKRRNLRNFELYQRFSKEKINSARWDNAFLERELSRENPNEIKKILVCGPPVMNETFDRALQGHVSNVKLSMINQLTFRRDQIEIL